MLQQIADAAWWTWSAGFFVYLLLARFHVPVACACRSATWSGKFIIAATNWMVAPARRVDSRRCSAWTLRRCCCAWLLQGVALLGVAMLTMAGVELSASAPGIARRHLVRRLALVDLLRCRSSISWFSC